MNKVNNGITHKDAVSLKDYFDDKFLASDKALILAFESLKIRLESIDKATEVARVSMEKRLDGMNEFRDALKDQAGKFVTRAELLAMIIGISTVISGVVTIVVRVLGK